MSDRRLERHLLAEEERLVHHQRLEKLRELGGGARVVAQIVVVIEERLEARLRGARLQLVREERHVGGGVVQADAILDERGEHLQQRGGRGERSGGSAR